MMIFSEGLETHGECTRYIELGGTGDGVILRLWLALQEGIHRAGLRASKFTAMSAPEAENGSRLMIDETTRNMRVANG
jgi:hypothetical protein